MLSLRRDDVTTTRTVVRITYFNPRLREGGDVVLFDAKISKENELYPLINTNFHEKAKEAEKKKQKQRQEQQESNDRIEEIILQMAELAPVTVRDLLSVLEITQEEAEKQLSFLCQQGYLIKSEEAGNIRYQKAG